MTRVLQSILLVAFLLCTGCNDQAKIEALQEQIDSVTKEVKELETKHPEVEAALQSRRRYREAIPHLKSQLEAQEKTKEQLKSLRSDPSKSNVSFEL